MKKVILFPIIFFTLFLQGCGIFCPKCSKSVPVQIEKRIPIFLIDSSKSEQITSLQIAKDSLLSLLLKTNTDSSTWYKGSLKGSTGDTLLDVYFSNDDKTFVYIPKNDTIIVPVNVPAIHDTTYKDKIVHDGFFVKLKNGLIWGVILAAIGIIIYYGFLKKFF